jgi:hypothetical protein
MTINKDTLLFMAFMFFTSTYALAYEDEDAVPLHLNVQGSGENIGTVSITLNGDRVSIITALDNQANVTKRMGFVAYTPFFDQPGIAEDHYDKSFSNLTVLLNDAPLKINAYRRGFFLGQDVTDKLVKAKIDPLPNPNVDTKNLVIRGLPLDNWQGYVSYSWVVTLPPHTSVSTNVRYRALPQFGQDEITSNRFNHLVLEHCGTPDEIRKFLTDTYPSIRYVYFERYEIPVMYARMHDVKITVSQPVKTALEIKPLVTLVCGVTGKTENASNLIDGVIANVDKTLSLLVISKFAGSMIEGDK